MHALTGLPDWYLPAAAVVMLALATGLWAREVDQWWAYIGRHRGQPGRHRR